MSYPPNPPEGAYPSSGGPQPGQGEPGYQPGSPYQPGTPYSSPPAGNPYPPPPGPGPEEAQPSSPFAAGQPTAAMPAMGGYQQQTQPAFQPGNAQVPPYPGGQAYTESFQPGPAQPSGPPTMSGPPAMDPMSGPPGYGAPYSGVPDYGAPKPKRGVAVPLFAGLTALFFIAAAVFGGLYFAKSSAYDKKTTQLNTKISGQSSQIDDLNKQVSSLKDQLDQAAQKQSGTQSQLDEQTKEKQVVSNCLSLLEQALTFAANGDSANAKATADKAQQPCDEASKYIS